MSFINLKESHWANKIWSRLANNFNLNSIQAHHFFCSEWEILPKNGNPTLEKHPSYNHTSPDSQNSHNPTSVSLTYLIYRGVFMLILLSSITFSTTCQSHLFHLFLTNWSFTSQNVYGILLFGNVLWRWWTFRSQTKGCTSSSSLLTLGQGCHNPVVLELEDTSESKRQQTFWTSKNPRIENGNSNQNQPDVVKSQVLSVEPYVHENGSVSILTSVVRNDDNCPQLKPQEKDGYQQEIVDRTQESRQTQNLTCLEKAIWILMNVVHVLPYCVVLGYWGVVYKYDPDQPACEKFRSHFIVHGATAVLAFTDALIIAIPARASHFIIPTGLVFLYVVFTCLYEAIGGPYRPGKEFIYSVLDWKNKPQKALIFSVLAVIATPVAHTVFCWGIYKLRMTLKSVYLNKWLRYWENRERSN